MAIGDTPILQQIEETADYHPPALYNLLTKYSRFSTEMDASAFTFLPLSQAAKSGRNPKLFVIGVLPPTANVSNRAIDRSASVAALDTAARTASEGGEEKPAKNYGPGIPPAIPAKDGRKDGAFFGKGAALTDQFWVNYVAMCGRLDVDPNELAKVLTLESGFNTSATNAVNGQPSAKGLTQLVRDTALGLKDANGTPMSAEEFDHFTELSAERQLYWAEKGLSQLGFKGQTSAGKMFAKNLGDGHAKSNPGGVLYASEAYQKANPGTYNQAKRQANAFNLNAATVDINKDGAITYEDTEAAMALVKVKPETLASIAKAQAAIAAGVKEVRASASPITADAEDGNFAQDGSKKASAAAKGIATAANGDLNKSTFGQQLQAAQEAFRKATQAALEQMARIPPLRLIVNPQSFSVASEKIISDGNYGRKGPIVEHWGEGQDKIEGSGKIAAFYAVDIYNSSSPGINRTARNASQSFGNLMSLYLLYKNNATLWLSDFNKDPKVRDVTLSVVGSIYIYYDGILYIGSFDTFTMSEADTGPYTLDYSFSFVVRSTFTLDVNDTQLQQLSLATGNTLPVRSQADVGSLDSQAGLVQPTASNDPVFTDVVDRANRIFNGGR